MNIFDFAINHVVTGLLIYWAQTMLAPDEERLVA